MAARDPNPFSPLPRVRPLRGPSPCGPHSEARGLSPPDLLAAFVAGARKRERGMREVVARRGVRRRLGGRRAVGLQSGRRGGDGELGGGWRQLSLGKLRASSGGWAVAQFPGFLFSTSNVTSSRARACGSKPSFPFFCVMEDHS